MWEPPDSTSIDAVDHEQVAHLLSSHVHADDMASCPPWPQATVAVIEGLGTLSEPLPSLTATAGESLVMRLWTGRSPSKAPARAPGSIPKASSAGPVVALAECGHVGHCQAPAKRPDVSRGMSFLSGAFIYTQQSKVSGF